MTSQYSSQNDLLLKNCLDFYKKNNNLDTMLRIINGESKISLRIVDWFATNYAKKRVFSVSIDFCAVFVSVVINKCFPLARLDCLLSFS